MHPRSSIPPTRDYQASSRRGSVAGWLVALLVVAGIVVGIAYGAYELADATAEPKARALTREVKKADLVITVTEDGNIESASNVEVKCQVAGGTSILWIVPDGEFVKDGQKIVELDSSALEESINQQRITFEKAKSAKIQAEKDYAVSKIAVTEYLEGVYKKELQDAGAQIKISLENLRTAQNSLAYTTRMFRKGYVSSLDLESQQFSVQRAQLELDSANTAKDVLVRFTKEKNLQELESQRDTAESRKDSETAAFELEEKRLKRLEDQMRLCIINAPASGMVVYANERGGRFGSQQSVTIEEGAAVRERQTILRLPDLEQMQVKVNVHETKVDNLRANMRARITVQGQTVTGVVDSIANQPEPTSWFSGSVKEYATIVKIAGEASGLKPGMTAEVEILIDHLEDRILLPVAAVVTDRGKYSCWVAIGEEQTPEHRNLIIGATNDKFVEIKDGVAVGDKVIMNPRAIVDDAKKAANEDEKEDDVDARFGAATENTPSGASGRQGGQQGGGRGGQQGGGQQGGGQRGGGQGGAGGGLMSLDKDGDKKISKDEAPSWMSERFDSFDANGDGFVDEKEIQALRSRSGGGQGRGGQGGGRGGQGGGAPGGRPGGGQSRPGGAAPNKG